MTAMKKSSHYINSCKTTSTGLLLGCLPQIFQKPTSLAFQSKTSPEKEVELLRVHNSRPLQELQLAYKKAMHYSDDLNSAINLGVIQGYCKV